MKIRVQLPTKAVIDIFVDTRPCKVALFKEMLSEAVGDARYTVLSVDERELDDEECVVEATVDGKTVIVSRKPIISPIMPPTSSQTRQFQSPPPPQQQQQHQQPSHAALLASLLRSSPHFQSLLDSSPHLRTALQNPALMDDLLAMMTDPRRYQEAMRSSDRAMAQMEMMPQGFQMLRQMHEQMERSEGVLGGIGGGGRVEGEVKEPKKRLQSKPLPNPWQNHANARSDSSEEE